MLGILGRRAIDLAVLFLALYAFAFVPLGRRTGLEHLRAMLGTPEAHDAGHELWLAAERLRHRLLDGEHDAPVGPTEAPVHTRGTAVVPKLPRRRAVANAAFARSDVADVPDASL